ncbi:acetyl-coenzyme A synthetase N-terminal domain-containing protein, partial [Paraburkholderia sp. RL17-373-BIF-A]|uniref:acetyl-coenzyme A synthetase N-terminal domain-containing protein n=1 Tax=Paraburkholderia sp. RL17-373-BIF-A TaxID=3031629 RepID=UPI0038B99272
MSTIDTAPPNAAASQIPLARHASIDGMEAYRALVAEAGQDHQAFWARLAREHLEWRRPFTKVLNDTNA